MLLENCETPSMSTDYWLPPRIRDREGHPRRTGFELEFGNLSVRETALALQLRLGGHLDEKNPFIYQISGTRLGRIKVERDASLLSSVKYRELLRKLNIDFDPGTLAREIEQGVDRLSSNLIPCEIVTEPLSFEQFGILDEVVEVLNALGAGGTQDSVVNAYGTHINPAAPNLDAGTLRAYLQAFLLLGDWIIQDAGTDFSRRYFTRFIDPFPESYLALVLDPAYRPSVAALIDDYLRHNPTRNRALDMLPIFSEIDSERVLAGVAPGERVLIKARPAFHYRLPDCRPGRPGWTVAQEWNRWWYVEVLAGEPALRGELMDDWLRVRRDNLFNRKGLWLERITGALGRIRQAGTTTDA